MPHVNGILARLDRARAGLLAAVEQVPAEHWRTPPAPGRWSAAEVLAHLTIVEGKITDGATKLIAGAPRPVPFWKRPHLPVWLAEWRGIRRKSPLPMDPSLVADREAMLARLAELRGRTTALLEQTRDRDLSAFRWPHPFFGSLNFYDWFKVVGHHEIRHTKQIREIVDSLPS